MSTDPQNAQTATQKQGGIETLTPAEREEFVDGAVRSQMEMFVQPEVARRQAAGTLPKPFALHRFQVIFPPKGGAPEVRINYEVRGVVKIAIKGSPGSSVWADLGTRGDAAGLPPEVEDAQVSEIEVEALLDFELAPGDADFGHFTCIKYGTRGFVGFNFRYNRASAHAHVIAAAEFLAASEFSMQGRRWSAFVDNLFSAAELLAKADLLLLLEMEAHSHGRIRSLYNLHFKGGQIPESHKATLNDLSSLRRQARYLTKGPFTLDQNEATKHFQNVQSMMQHVRQNSAITDPHAA